MGYTFTDDQKARILAAFNEAKAGGSWAKAYELVASIVATEQDASGAMPIDTNAQVQASVLWLLGASQANAGDGAFSTLIREYTARQYQLHFGVPVPDSGIQTASDAVARRVLRTILDTKQLPTVNEIAGQDATAVGQVLFDYTPTGAPYDGTAGDPRINAAWSGAALFSFFDHGTVEADQTGRLLSTGESGARMDSINDLRDALFAYEAFDAAFSVTGTLLGGFGNVFVEEVIEVLKRGDEVSDYDVFSAMLSFGGISLDKAQAALTDGAGGLLVEMTKGSAAHNELAFVAAFGPEALLDHLLRLFGPAPQSPTTEATFVERAHTLFSQLKSGGQLDLKVQRLDELLAGPEPVLGWPLSVNSLVALAQQDSATGRAVLYALNEMSPFIVLGKSEAQTAALYARFAGDGALSAETYSEQYLTDRARMMSQLFVVRGTQGVSENVLFTDQAHGITVGPAADAGAPIEFDLEGTGGNDVITGTVLEDRLCRCGLMG